MLLRAVDDPRLAQTAYLIGCQATGEAIVIDPERDVDRYIDLAKRHGLRIVAAAETHIHADFLSGVRELAERVGATAYVSGTGGAEWSAQWLDKRRAGGTYAHRALVDGDRFLIGQIEFTALATPGHTPEHIAFLLVDRGSGAVDPIGIVTGDFVFVGDLGRPDLLESAVGQKGAADASARTLFRSLRRFLDLPDWLQVWPGHGAGSACGKALGAVPQSTVGYERRLSPAIAAARDEETFVQFILDGQPEPPGYFPRMKRENRDGPAILGALPQPKRITSSEELGRLASNATVLDVRTWSEFRGGHLRGALFTPLDNSFPTIAGSYVDPDTDVVLIADPAKIEECVRCLVRVGIDRVVGWAEPAILAGLPLALSKETDVRGARALLESKVDGGGALVLDVRKADEFAAGHIEGARNIAHTRLVTALATLPKNAPILCHCKLGGRSAYATALLEKHGFNVTNLAGGFEAWKKAGEPVLA